MRSCTPGAERALSLNTVPRIRKSSTWLYFFFAGLLVDAVGVGTEEGVCGVAGSCAWAIAMTHGARSAAVQRTMIHCRGRIALLLKHLDGGMSTGGCQAGRGCPLLLVFFFLFFVIIIVNEVAIFADFALFFLVVLFVLVIGDEVQVDRMRLRDLKFRLTLRTTQDLAFFDFVFVHIDFGGTFWTTDHGAILRRVVRKVGVRGRPPPLCSVLYTAVYEVNSRARCGCLEQHGAESARTSRMASSREYPERPVVGIGGVIVDRGRALLTG